MNGNHRPHVHRPAERRSAVRGAINTVGAGAAGAWSHWVSFLLGLMLFVAPWAVGYAQNLIALALSLFLGPVIAIFAFLGLVAEPESAWSRRVVFAAGLVAFTAPFVLGLAIPRPAAWSLIVLGGLAVFVSATAIFTHPNDRVA